MWWQGTPLTPILGTVSNGNSPSDRSCEIMIFNPEILRNIWHISSNVYINLSKYESERTRPPEFEEKTRSCRQSACSKQLDHSFLQGSTGPPLAGYITNHIKSKHQDPYSSVSNLPCKWLVWCQVVVWCQVGLATSEFEWIFPSEQYHSALFREDKSVAPSKPPQM